jgi:UDP-N-acetylglucosamine:LPS N-acetylglucosamine transferase
VTSTASGGDAGWRPTAQVSARAGSETPRGFWSGRGGRNAMPRKPGSKTEKQPRRPRLLAGASGGGHWIELLRLRPAFDGFDVAYVSTFATHADVVEEHRYYRVPDTSRFRVTTMIPVFVRALFILLKERPTALITTGSAPMLPFIALGRLLGARTLWIDSIANSEHLSTSGRIAKRLAHRCLAQWPAVGEAEAIECWGKVL